MERPSAAGRWLDRNAKWLVPLMILAFIGLGFEGTQYFLEWFDSHMRSLPAYRMALQELRANREANDILGSPIQAAEGQIRGNLKSANKASQAMMSIPVQGPRAKGNLVVFATAVDGDWTLRSVALRVADPARTVTIMNR